MDPAVEGGELPRHAPDGQPLTQRQAKHMQKNRFRCEACASNFCCSCKTLPYHTAATCEQAAAARCAAKCRFCQVQLPRGKKDGSSCGSSECEERMGAACELTLSCGHRCLGTFAESECAPCLECAEQADDFCNICWTEELRAAPCLRLRFSSVLAVLTRTLHIPAAPLPTTLPLRNIALALLLHPCSSFASCV